MARHVDKAIILHQGALRAKYGADGLATIRAALDRMAEADRAREISSRLVAIDRAGTMKGLGGPTVSDATDAMAVKAAVDAAADGVTAHYVMLLGAPDVVPQQRLRNPTGDEDPDVPSDLPYACRAPASDDPGDFVGPVRAVGRLPDLPGATDPSFLVRLIDQAAGWTSRAPSAYRPGVRSEHRHVEGVHPAVGRAARDRRGHGPRVAARRTGLSRRRHAGAEPLRQLPRRRHRPALVRRAQGRSGCPRRSSRPRCGAR